MPKKRSKNNAKQQTINHNLQKRSHPGHSNASTNVNRTAPGKNPKENSNFRTNAQIKLLNMYNEKPNKEQREKTLLIIQAVGSTAHLAPMRITSLKHCWRQLDGDVPIH